MDSPQKGWPIRKPEQFLQEKVHLGEEKLVAKVSPKAPYIRSFCNGSIVGYIVGLLATSRPLLAKGQVKMWLLSQLLTGVTVGILWTLANHVRRRKWISKS